MRSLVRQIFGQTSHRPIKQTRVRQTAMQFAILRTCRAAIWPVHPIGLPHAPPRLPIGMRVARQPPRLHVPTTRINATFATCLPLPYKMYRNTARGALLKASSRRSQRTRIQYILRTKTKCSAPYPGRSYPCTALRSAATCGTPAAPRRAACADETLSRMTPGS
jgi:hypothetical protein